MKQPGKVYLVGAGPGDPGLISLRGVECLGKADVVLYDGLVNPLLLRHATARCERTCRSSAPGGRILKQDEINQRIVEEAVKGKTVVRLKGGDPFIFGRGSEEAAFLREQGIEYEIVPGITAAVAAAGSAIRKVGFPFVSAIASEQMVGLLQWYHDNSVGRKQRLPLPSSFLIDAQGRVAVIYKGPLAVDVLLADVAHSEGTRRERWARAAMLPGRFIEHESIVRSAAKIDAKLFFGYAEHDESRGALDLAVHYYQEALRNRPDYARARRGLGSLHAKRAQWQEALAQFTQLIVLEPTDAAAHYAAGVCHQQLGQGRAARSQFEKAVELQPDHLPALDALARIAQSAGDAAAASGYFRAVVRAAPRSTQARNNLAWVLATSRDEAVRNGVEALELATQLVREELKPRFLDTLAAAQAEMGQFQEAVETARQAVEMARDAQDEATAAQIEKRISLYERGERYRE